LLVVDNDALDFFDRLAPAIQAVAEETAESQRNGETEGDQSYDDEHG
jgi:hypothetical protein